MNIKVCVGSSCHLKGSYEVIQSLKKYIEDNKLEDKVELSKFLFRQLFKWCFYEYRR